MALDDVYEYFTHYDRASFQVIACKGNEPSEADVAAFEAEIGFRLPDEFREFTLSSLGGLYMAVREELWPRPRAYDVAPAWAFAYGFMVFGIAATIPDWLDIREQHREFADDGVTGLVPFLKIECDADRYCFDAAGRILLWDHESPDEREVVDESFSELMMRQIRELEERKEWKIRG